MWTWCFFFWGGGCLNDHFDLTKVNRRLKTCSASQSLLIRSSVLYFGIDDMHQQGILFNLTHGRTEYQD